MPATEAGWVLPSTGADQVRPPLTVGAHQSRRGPLTGPAADQAFVIVTDRIPLRRADSATLGLLDLPDDPVTAALSAMAREADALWMGRQTREFSSSPATVAGQEVVVPADEIRHAERYSRLTLWPLYHAQSRAVHNRHWETAYRRVNLRFARSVAERAGHRATVWIHDYRLQLLPGLLRRLRPDLRIGFSMPIPFPPPDLFRLLPMHEEIRQGLLGSDLIGFQTALAADNFRRLPGVPAGSAEVGTYPLSVDTAKIRALAGRPDVRARADELRARLGAGPVVLGIDSTDDADGVERRLRALGDVFVRSPDRDGLTVIQVLIPSGSPAVSPDGVDGVARQVARINGEAGAVGRAPVHYLVDEPSLSQRVALYLAADVMMATPGRPGTHLPALEYIAARPDGRIILSEFTATGAMLAEAFTVNPYDEDELRQALRTALATGAAQWRQRMRSMRERVTAYDHRAWLEAFLADLKYRATGAGAQARTK